MREAVPHELCSPLLRVEHQVEPEGTAVRSGSLPLQECARAATAFVITLYRHAPKCRLFSHLSLRSVVGRGYPCGEPQPGRCYSASSSRSSSLTSKRFRGSSSGTKTINPTTSATSPGSSRSSATGHA